MVLNDRPGAKPHPAKMLDLNWFLGFIINKDALLHYEKWVESLGIDLVYCLHLFICTSNVQHLILLMVQKSGVKTSWGWYFIPLFTGGWEPHPTGGFLERTIKSIIKHWSFKAWFLLLKGPILNTGKPSGIIGQLTGKLVLWDPRATIHKNSKPPGPEPPILALVE